MNLPACAFVAAAAHAVGAVRSLGRIANDALVKVTSPSLMHPVMDISMFRFRNQLKVADDVIRGVLVDMVNIKSSRYRTMLPFPHKPMFSLVRAWSYPRLFISAANGLSASPHRGLRPDLMLDAVRATTVFTFAALCPCIGNIKSLAAMEAGTLSTHRSPLSTAAGLRATTYRAGVFSCLNYTDS